MHSGFPADGGFPPMAGRHALMREQAHKPCFVRKFGIRKEFGLRAALIGPHQTFNWTRMKGRCAILHARGARATAVVRGGEGELGA
ncbi:hypothetical protein [Streptomyces axinellae]|uniref:hypothetical protein n=1 Tax=Streptomyces axinellae TaxID=552788 RepID=UPI0031D63D0F